jgi:hypothetical protein
MNVIAAIAAVAVGALIAASLPRPLQEDKRVWHRKTPSTKPPPKSLTRRR